MDTPPTLENALAQFYTFLKGVAAQQGLTDDQNLVVNSTIVPMDLAADTPYYNQELFREYADRTFRGGVESIQPAPPVSSASRFSSQYKSLINISAANVDQNHPEIVNSVNELQKQQDAASSALGAKIIQLDSDWEKIATSRHLTPGTADYDLQRVAWYAQIRYADQIQSYSDKLDSITSQLDSVRRKVYTASEIALLDNVAALGRAYNIARPWQAVTERSFKSSGNPLSDLMLADPTKLAPALFDSSPLIQPIGDLGAFLSGQGLRSLDTNTQSYSMSDSERSWTASGGGSFLGYSLGGGGSGSSSFKTSMSKLNSFHADFKNVAEYLIDRSAWFNPAVLQDAAILKLIDGRAEILNLQYVAVSLIIVRGLTLTLKFSEQIDVSNFSQSSFNAHGGASFCGFSFGGGGSSSRSDWTVTSDASGTTITFQDGDSVGRVLGTRVEKFMSPPKRVPQNIHELTTLSPDVANALEDFKRGHISYLDLQNRKLAVMRNL